MSDQANYKTNFGKKKKNSRRNPKLTGAQRRAARAQAKVDRRKADDLDGERRLTERTAKLESPPKIIEMTFEEFDKFVHEQTELAEKLVFSLSGEQIATWTDWGREFYHQLMESKLKTLETTSSIVNVDDEFADFL